MTKEKTLDPLLDWIPDQSLSSTFVIGDRGQASRMTEGGKQESRVSESLSFLLSVIPDPDRGSSVSLLTNEKSKKPWILDY